MPFETLVVRLILARMFHQNREKGLNEMIDRKIHFSIESRFLMFNFLTILLAGMRGSPRCRTGKRLVTHFSARQRVFVLRLALHHILAS